MGNGVAPVHNHTLYDALLQAAALAGIQNRLLDVAGIAQRTVHHAQAPEGLHRGQVAHVVAHPGHQQGVLAALPEVELAVGQLARHGQGQVDAVRPERRLHHMLLGPLYDVVPTLMTNQVVLLQQLPFVLVPAVDGRPLLRCAIVGGPRPAHSPPQRWHDGQPPVPTGAPHQGHRRQHQHHRHRQRHQHILVAQQPKEEEGEEDSYK